MSELSSRNLRASSLKTILALFLGLSLFGASTVWAGIPTEVPFWMFIVGVSMFLLSLILSGYSFWHLLIRTLPEGHKLQEQRSISIGLCRLIAALVAISGINIVVGGFWDEAWHRLYGLPFGEDLLWRPHLLIYAGFLVVSFLAVGAFISIMRGTGTLQQRFRTQPILGLLVLMGAFLVFAIPTDPIWHTVYGEDITAWSLPHLILTISFVLIMIIAAAIQLSTLPGRAWSSLRGIKPPEALVLVPMAFMLLVSLQVLTTEWDVITSIPNGPIDAFWARPEWLLPALISACSVFIGLLATHGLQRWGSATISAVLAFSIRLALVGILGVEMMSARAWLVAIAPALTLDLATWISVRLRNQAPSWAISGLAGSLGMVLVGFPLINSLFIYPNISASNLAVLILSCLVASIGAAWAGSTAGKYLSEANKQVEVQTVQSPGMVHTLVRLVPAAAFLAQLALIIFFIATAIPPV